MNTYQQAEFSRAVSAQQNGDINVAIEVYRKLYQEDVRTVDLLHLYGVGLHQTGQHNQAVPLLKEALTRSPKNLPIHINLAIVYKALGRIKACVKQYQTVLSIDPDHLEALQSLVFHLRELRCHEQAIEYAKRALATAPNHDQTHNNTGNLYNDIGDLAQAQDHYRKAVAINPKNGQAWANFATTKKFSETDREVIEDMQSILNAGDLPPAQASQLNFAIGKAYKDLNDPDSAFPYYRRQHELMPATNFPWHSFETYLAEVRSVYTADYFASLTSLDRQDSPVFIVGMLRSGTSLLERILAAHSGFCGIGERPEIARLTQRIESYPKVVPKIPDQVVQQLADLYLQQVRQHYDRSRQRPVDKMMTNFMHIGFIYRLFPNAKIIHAKRHPYAVCLSCYLQNFAQPPGWAKSLDDIGRYYRNYQQMMAFWAEHFPSESIIDVAYEDLLESPETEIRRMLKFCEVPWEDACLTFHRSKGVVKTASNWQVRQPLNQRNAEQWRKFESYLGDLDKWLHPPCEQL